MGADGGACYVLARSDEAAKTLHDMLQDVGFQVGYEAHRSALPGAADTFWPTTPHVQGCYGTDLWGHATLLDLEGWLEFLRGKLDDLGAEATFSDLWEDVYTGKDIIQYKNGRLIRDQDWWGMLNMAYSRSVFDDRRLADWLEGVNNCLPAKGVVSDYVETWT